MLDFAQYTKVETLQEALDRMDSAVYKVFVGGTDVIPHIRAGAIQGANLLDLQPLRAELGDIRVDEDYLYIGALCRHYDLQRSDLLLRWCPPLAEACSKIGSAQIRKRGTIGGNIVNASPAADVLPTLVATDAKAVLQSAQGKRTVLVAELAISPGKTQIQPNELLTEILIPLDDDAWDGAYSKVGSRNALSIAMASVAILKHPTFGWRIACGSVGPTVQRARHVEAVYGSENATEQAFCEALAADISPINDVRATADYRAQTLCNLIFNCYTYGLQGKEA